MQPLAVVLWLAPLRGGVGGGAACLTARPRPAGRGRIYFKAVS